MSKEFIRIGGAREHNLKNLTLEIPRDKLVVITGLSGSGKSSLAFDTIYAEGQRKYVESLSAYARQFLDQMQKPDVDYIEGLSPAIAIEQRSSGTNPRSIVATTTEIYDYLRLLYAHVGQPHCPDTGVPIVAQTTSDIVDKILALPPQNQGDAARAGRARAEGRVPRRDRAVAARRFRPRPRGRRAGRTGRSERARQTRRKQAHTIEAVVDRLVIDDKVRVRLQDSVETALRWGEGVMLTLHQLPELATKADGQSPKPAMRSTSVGTDESGSKRCTRNRMYSPATGKSYEPLTPKHFSFNAPSGACPVCHGLGQKMVFDEGLVVPDPEKSLEQGAVLPWRRGGKRMIIYYKAMLRAVAGHYGQSLETPYKDLPDDFKKILLHGSGEDGDRVQFLARGQGEQGQAAVRRRAAEPGTPLRRERKRVHPQPAQGFMSPQFCDACNGKRLKPEILAVTLGSESLESHVSGQSLQRRTT